MSRMGHPSDQARSGNRPGAGKPPKELIYDSIGDKPYNCTCSTVILPGGRVWIKYMDTMCAAEH